MSDAELPEPDRIEGARHPREVYELFGHEDAEETFLRNVASDRLHHAWMITGPRGVGKATLAWRMARYLLTLPPDDGPSLFGEPAPMPTTLDSDPNSALNQRIEALSEPRLMLIRRGPSDDGKRLKTQISVDEVRKLNGFFGLSAADGGYRVVIIDCLDEMNPASANALLKLLEEPPKKAVLLLVCHQPSRVLPTIRSRCRELRLAPLGAEALSAALQSAGADTDKTAALSELSGGSVGRTLSLIQADGIQVYAEILSILASAPQLDRAKATKLAESAGARGAEATMDVLVDMLDLAMSRIAKAGAGALPNAEIVPNENEMLTGLSYNSTMSRAWAELQNSARSRIEHGRAVNVAPQGLILDVFLKAGEIVSAT